MSDLTRRNWMQGTTAAVGGMVLAARTSQALQTATLPQSQLTWLTESPRNGEPNLPELVRNWITPQDKFYVRSHADNPAIDPATFRLQIDGMVARPTEISLQELADRFEEIETTATLTCAGNRRSELIAIKPISGVEWTEGAIGNAKWSGYKLSELLKLVGVKSEASHVWFEGADQISLAGETIPFGGSIPLAKALADLPDSPGAMLATQMNGEPLNADHGFPLRTIVPGYIGARSVKWLSRITLADRPSPNHYVADAYKLLYSTDPLEHIEAAPIYRFIINSVTANWQNDGSEIQLTGYALPTGFPDCRIQRVELSLDEGTTWMPAKLGPEDQPLCWRLWSAKLPASMAGKTIVVRATDTLGRQQPQLPNWNVKGYMSNAWHHRKLVDN